MHAPFSVALRRSELEGLRCDTFMDIKVNVFVFKIIKTYRVSGGYNTLQQHSNSALMVKVTFSILLHGKWNRRHYTNELCRDINEVVYMPIWNSRDEFDTDMLSRHARHAKGAQKLGSRYTLITCKLGGLMKRYVPKLNSNNIWHIISARNLFQTFQESLYIKQLWRQTNLLLVRLNTGNVLKYGDPNPPAPPLANPARMRHSPSQNLLFYW
jgi:hypothetical protein